MFTNLRTRFRVSILLFLMLQLLLGLVFPGPYATQPAQAKTTSDGQLEQTQVGATGLSQKAGQTALSVKVLTKVGSPIANAQVVIVGLGVEKAGKTDAQGFLKFEGLIAAKPYTFVEVSVAAPGHIRWLLKQARLIPNDTLQVRAELSAATSPQAENEVETITTSTPHWELPHNASSNQTSGDSSITPKIAPRSSNTVPPATIRVCRVSLGRVDVVPFSDYLKGVLPNEWIASWPAESLKTGAIAAKTYAWYWVNQGGKYSNCDVRDNTSDQVYDPTSTYQSTNQAVDQTANVVMTRNNAIFQAHYCAGYAGDGSPSDNQCGQVAGDFVSQYGSQYWAAQGKDYSWILSFYYSNINLSNTGSIVSLNVPYVNQVAVQGSPHSGLWTYCGPASAAMVLGYYGKSSNPSQDAGGVLKDELFAWGTEATVWDPQYSYSLPQVLARRGVNGRVTPSGSPLTFAQIKTEIDAGRPLIFGAGYSGNISHIAVIIGYDNASQSLVIHDPFGQYGWWGDPVTIGQGKFNGQTRSVGNFQLYPYSDFITHVGNMLVFTTNPPSTSLPADPIQLGVTPVSATQVTLFWGDESNNEDGFNIERREGLNGIWKTIKTVGPNTVSYSDNTLQSEVTYYYRVRAYNSAGSSGYSNLMLNTELMPIYRFYNPSASSYLYTASISEALYVQNDPAWTYQGIAFQAHSYNNNTCNNTKAVPVYRVKSGNDSRIHYYTADYNEYNDLVTKYGWQSEGIAFCAFAKNNQVAGSVPTFNLARVNDGGNHLLTNSVDEKNYAISSGGWTDAGIAFYTIAAPLSEPQPPSTQLASDTQVNLDWSATASGLTGFTIERRTTLTGGWQQITSLAATITTYQDKTVHPGVSYFYRIRGFNDATRSGYSYLAIANPGNNTPWPVYRFFATQHMLATWTTEVNALLKTGDYHLEGLAFYAYNPSQCPSNTAPVYRLYYSPTGSHLFTASLAEKNTVSQWVDWHYEGIAMCVYTTPIPGTETVYRFHNPYSNDYVFTADENEKAYLSAQPDWNYEGIAFYGLKPPYIVTSTTDAGNTATGGTLSNALNQAKDGQFIILAPEPGNTITVKGSLPPLAKGAKIQAACSSPVTISGNDPAASADGLTLLGNNYLTGIKLSGFRGRQIVLQGTGNHFSCSSFSKV